MKTKYNIDETIQPQKHMVSTYKRKIDKVELLAILEGHYHRMMKFKSLFKKGTKNHDRISIEIERVVYRIKILTGKLKPDPEYIFDSFPPIDNRLSNRLTYDVNV